MQALKVTNLNKTYANGFVAIKDVNLEITQGGFFGLLGPNGAGKSTTINILSSLIKKTSGKVFIMGYDLDAEEVKAKSCLGIIPQEINLAMFENIVDILVNQAGFYGVPRKIAAQRAEKYLNLLDLWGKRNNIAKDLSGGMKRRLMIARALMHEPQILILDEPTAGVDIEIRYLIWQLLLNLNKEGKTILLTSHYLEEVEKLCKNIAIIHRGNIIEQGNLKEILNKLDQEIFVVNLTKPLSQAQLADSEVLKIIDSQTIELLISNAYNLGDVIAMLVAKGIGIKSISTKVNKLENFFLQVTKN
jgi:ABC-2 type transport system ATP-binding protein